TAGQCAPDLGAVLAVACTGPLLTCGGACVDPMKDLRNCGGCGVACLAGNVCIAGACSLVCDEGLTICEGRCVDSQSDLAHCGGCGKACRQAEVCSRGRCAPVCAPG